MLDSHRRSAFQWCCGPVPRASGRTPDQGPAPADPRKATEADTTANLGSLPKP
jgi:hypothetical protein